MIIAVDTGGTKTLISSFDSNGLLGQQVKIPTPQDPILYIEAVRKTIKDGYLGQQIDAIVVAIPGVVKEGVALWCGNLPWQDFDVRTALQNTLENVPVYVENDAKLAGLSETRLLGYTPKQSLYVTISTGIGMGIIIDGHIHPALRNSEGGHALIEYDGAVQEWEDFASGRVIHEVYGQYASEITDPSTWLQIADRISRGFLAVVPILQPDIIIIGGSIGTYFEKYSQRLQDLLKEKLPVHIPCPKFVQAKYPELAVVYGCYYYALDNFTPKTTV
jgi:predicted NBD/HSP70 family sugar kinase